MEDSRKSDVRVEYADPVGQLLNAGEPSSYDPSEWPDYAAKFGLAPEHIPELIQLACDKALNQADSDSGAVWAPMHAWRALGQLKAEASVPPLLGLLKAVGEDEAAIEELPVVFGMVGLSAMPHIARFLSDETIEVTSAATAMTGLKEIADRHPESRGECVGILAGLLGGHVHADPATNGFVVATLMNMAAVEAIDAIRTAFRRNSVDISICGDEEDVELEFGLRDRRSTPAPRYQVVSAMATARPDVNRILENSHVPGTSKVGRNDPCPCGSGKKYKKCCLQ